MMDDSALTKTLQKGLPQKRTVVAEVCGDTYSKKLNKKME